MFSTFLMWLLADLFHDLPEVGDVDKPKLVFFFDEAHLLFNDASKDVPRRDRADRAADPVQGRRRLLRDPVADRRTRRRAGAARLAGPAPAARRHAQRRQGAQADGEHLPDLGVRRPRRGDPLARHRRGGRHGDERAGRPDAGRVDPAAGARVADGPRRPGRDDRSRRGVAAAREVRRGGRPRVGPREARRRAGGRRRAGRAGGAGAADEHVDYPRTVEAEARGSGRAGRSRREGCRTRSARRWPST